MADAMRTMQARMVGYLEIGPCPRCGEPVRWKGRGRKPRWCSPTCRVRAKEARRAARDNERPLSVVDGPAKPDNADERAALLADPRHERMLMRVLRAVAHTRRMRGRAGEEADALVEEMFALPAGSGVRLREGLPLADADERAAAQRARHEQLARAERDRGRIAAVERVAYERGRADGYAAGRDQARRASAQQRAGAVGPQPQRQAGMSRQQRRAAERAAAKQRRTHDAAITADSERTLPGMDQ